MAQCVRSLSPASGYSSRRALRIGAAGCLTPRGLRGQGLPPSSQVRERKRRCVLPDSNSWDLQLRATWHHHAPSLLSGAPLVEPAAPASPGSPGLPCHCTHSVWMSVMLDLKCGRGSPLICSMPVFPGLQKPRFVSVSTRRQGRAGVCIDDRMQTAL